MELPVNILPWTKIHPLKILVIPDAWLFTKTIITTNSNLKLFRL